MKYTINTNDYLKFLPLFIIYIIICFIKQQDILVGDEDDYLLYAENIINGFYADASHEYSYLWNGPGYPLFLAIFRLFNISLVLAKLFNCIFLYIGIVYFYKTLKQIICKKKALYIAIALGLYYPLLVEALPKLLTEALSFCLISLFAYSLFKYLTRKSKKHKWISSIVLGYLILTKIFFAYVVFGSLLIIFPFLFYNKTQKYVKQYSTILFLGFCFTTPYLFYTYHETNKFFYYGNSGGMSLYWMSTPYENESGDWHSFKTLESKPEIYKNHKSYIDSIKNLHPIDKDIILKKKAIHNILNNKNKFFKNWLSNLGRLFFNYPYYLQKTDYKFFIYLIPKILIFLSLFIAFFLNLKNFKKISPFICSLGFFSILYLGGLSFLSSYPRFLHVILPILLLWISYTFNEFFSIKNLN